MCLLRGMDWVFIYMYIIQVMCFVCIWEQTAIISLYSINRLVFITETECVYCAVRTGSLYIIQVMCFVWIWEQTAIISLYIINWLVFIIETECVYCAVRTGSNYECGLAKLGLLFRWISDKYCKMLPCIWHLAGRNHECTALWGLLCVLNCLTAWGFPTLVDLQAKVGNVSTKELRSSHY